MSAHTPGPWRWIKAEDYPSTRLVGPDGADVIEIYESHGGGTMATEADAHLIAAAPDLLAALTNFIDSAVTDSDTCAICRSDWTRHASGCAVVVALHAIAKAAA
jgi:hypothetical protein